MGGGKRHKKSKNLENSLKNSSIHSELFYKFRLKNFKSFQNSRGAILIEFVFGVSVLITLIFYVHDLYLLSRYQSQTHFIGEQIANIIQSISQNRANKKITRNDLKNAVATAYQSVYPGTTMYGNRKHVFGHFPHPIIYYVKGLENGNASCIWRVHLHTGSGGVSVGIGYGDYDISTVRYKTNINPSDIHPSLKIKAGEMKIIIDALIYYKGNDGWWQFADGSPCNLPPYKIFSCFLISPKSNNSSGKWVDDAGYFNSIVIFTPKPGLFDETPPQ